MTKLIAEIGINHNGSYQEAKKLINMASLANCWGVKFQYRNLNNYFSNLSKSSELGKEIIDEEIKKNHLNHKQILKLATYAKKNIKVGLSLFLKKDYQSFEKYKFDFLKIPSPVCHDYELINFLKNKSKIICFIPARSGSTRIKNKNIKLINGRPLIYWTVSKAIKCEQFDKIIFSSDNDKYFKILIKYLKKDKLNYEKIFFNKREITHSKTKSKIFDYLKFDLIKKFNLKKKIFWCKCYLLVH